MRKPNYQEYKFNNVYEFANIISKIVDDENGFCGYNERQFIESSCKFSKITLLHIYIYTQLLNYYHHEYRELGTCYDEEEYDKWVNIAENYGTSFKTEYSLDNDNNIYQWYQDNVDVFEELFKYIADEVFYILFSNYSFLVKFNRIVVNEIKNDEGQRDWEFPQNCINHDRTIIRKKIPEWAKKAVFYRDHGKCVFCGKDLDVSFTKTRSVNYDHIIPLNKYGANDPCNLQTTCEHCNKSKKNKELYPLYKYEPWW